MGWTGRTSLHGPFGLLFHIPSYCLQKVLHRKWRDIAPCISCISRATLLVLTRYCVKTFYRHSVCFFRESNFTSIRSNCPLRLASRSTEFSRNSRRDTRKIIESHRGKKSIHQRERSLSKADILALKHESRILGHCNNPGYPALPLGLVCWCGISSRIR